MNQKQLNVLKNKWQKRLRLMDWEIEVNLIRQNKMKNPNNVGEASYNVQRKTATLNILCSMDRDNNDVGGYESDIVHEMLHLLLPGFTPGQGTLDHDLYEQGLNMIVEALLKP